MAKGAGDYEPRNVLITGGAGFIASHVAARLVRQHPEYTVVVLDKLEYCASMKNLEAVQDCANFRFVKGDIRSKDILRFIFLEYDIETVLHFAAQTHVDNSFGNSLAFSVANVYGTHCLLEACREWGKIKRFVNVSTDEVYGDQSFGKELGNSESSTLEPTNPYSAAKAGAEMMVSAYSRSHQIPCIITRGNNIYGPHQFPEKLVPKFILLAHRGLALPIHGTGQNARSFLYVEDVAEAYDVVLHKGKAGEIYNIGTDKEKTILDVAKDVCHLCSLDSDSSILFVRDRLYNDRRYFVSDKKLRDLGWQPRVSWDEGLRQTVEWYQSIDPLKYWKGNDVEEALKPHPVIRSNNENALLF